MNKISAVVLTKNSQSTLDKCLKSLSFCDELIVVDDYSIDKTRNIARKYKAKIYKRLLDNDFAAQRNFGLSKARNEWVLFLDSDEVINKFTVPSGYDAFFIQRIDKWLGKEIKFGENNIKLLRFARKRAGKWFRRVHEFWKVKGKVGVLDAVITHFPHPGVSDFVAEINVYSTIHSRENKKSGRKASVLKIVIYPFLKFLANFVLKSGFRDGTHGFVVATIMSFHSFLSWSQLWLSTKKKY